MIFPWIFLCTLVSWFTKSEAFPSQPCPTGWYPSSSPFVDKCYQVVTATALGWFAAEKACQDLATGNFVGHLVAIHNQTERDNLQAIVQNFTATTGADGSQPFWVGAYDYQTPGAFQWTDGSPFDYNAWDNGQPGSTSSCVEAELGSPGFDQWNTGDCKNYVNSYVCQAVPKPSSCQDGWSYLEDTNKCYAVFKGVTDFDSAETICNNIRVQGVRAHLASSNDTNTNNFILSLVLDPLIPRCNGTIGWYWIGLLKTADTTTPTDWAYAWQDGTAYGNSYFAQGQEPNPVNANDRKAVQFASATCRTQVGQVQVSVNRGQWNTVDPALQLPFVCSVPAPAVSRMRLNLNEHIMPPPPPGYLVHV